MRLSTCFLASALLASPTLAAAGCYSIFSAENRLVYQSTVPPIDLSRRISDAMRDRFPGGFFVMTPDETACRELRDGGRVTRPRLDAVGQVPGSAVSPDQLLEASPLFQDVSGYGGGTSRGGGYVGGSNATLPSRRR